MGWKPLAPGYSMLLCYLWSGHWGETKNHGDFMGFRRVVTVKL